MTATVLSAVKELMDSFDHALLHRDTSVCVRMSAEDWAKFQTLMAESSGTPVADVAQKAVAAATVTPQPGQEVHVQFQAGDFHALSEAHAAAASPPAEPAE